MFSKQTHGKIKLLVIHAALVFSTALFAQRVEQPSIDDAQAQPNPPVNIATTPPTAATDDDDIVEMSVFNVTAQDDDAYQGISTTSGSRLKTSLRDTAASISPFTEEFLSDIGATNLDDMLAFAGNVEVDVEDSTNGFNNNNTLRAAGSNNNGFRIRGMGASISSNFVDSSIPMDMYNVDRAEVASGANSILFGMGSPGGIAILSPRKANVRRNRFRVSNTVGTWYDPGQSWSYERLVLDYNIALIPRTLGIRLIGLYQNAGDWKYWVYNDAKRINPLVMIKPFRNTVIHIGYEAGVINNSTTRSFGYDDKYTAWDDAGRPLSPALGQFPIGTTPEGNPIANLMGTSDDYVFVGNNNTLYNFRNAAQSLSRYNANPATLEMNDNYKYSSAGPGGHREQKFQAWSVVLEQKIGKLNLQLGYYHNRNDIMAQSPGNNVETLRGDPNPMISPPQWRGTGTSFLEENPYAGGLYVQSVWFQNTLTGINDVARLTGEYAVNLKRLGRHQIVGMYEHAENEMLRDHKNEILVDGRGVPIASTLTSGTNATNSANQLWRRQYVTEGDFSTYYDGNGDIPVASFSIGDRVFHSTFAQAAQNASHTFRTTDSFMIALQSYWFNNRVVTTLGGRIDNLTFQGERNNPDLYPDCRITDVNDPRVLSGKKSLWEVDFNGVYDTYKFTPFTFTGGIVYHLTNRFSLFYNHGTNRGAPNLDGRTVLPVDADRYAPSKTMPPLTDGITQDYGVMIDVFGNNKVFLRLTRYDTHQLHDAAMIPNGIAGADSVLAGSANLAVIYARLYENPLVPAEEGGSQRELITAAQYANRPHWNAGMTDIHTKGYEVELTANPTKNITMRFTYSYSDRNRENLYQEVIDYYNSAIPWFWELTRDDLAARQLIYRALYDPLTNQSGGIFWDSLEDTGTRYQVANSVRYGLADQLSLQSGPLGSRPHKFNVTMRYRLPGALKGAAIGGAVRYQSPNLMPAPVRTHSEEWPNGLRPDEITLNTEMPRTLELYSTDYTQDMVKGQSTLFYDAFINYQRKIFRGKTTMKIQLNVRNMFNNDTILVGRINEDGTVRRYYTNEPRTIRLMAEFIF
ncbi:MAG: TonB-dependent receptor plug domain-containing protein [Opitutaceae bacterium]|jgi:outer membrane receptor protein involved in Fe transport|nr:TonB-dependent receptor plug domain-containing protein [Opitutaceae bacterium]